MANNHWSLDGADLVANLVANQDRSWQLQIMCATELSYQTSEGPLICWAEACRAHRTASKNESIHYSLGSVLECSDCVDIGECKSLSEHEQRSYLKERLASTSKRG